MILESVLSCSYLSLTSGCCIYTLKKESYEQYSKLLPHFAFAIFGIAGIAVRSFIALTYKLFFKTYALDPALIETDEERNRLKFNALDQVLGTLSMASLIYSLYSRHRYSLLGACIVGSLSTFDLFNLYQRLSMQKEVELSEFNEFPRKTEKSATRGSIVFLWIFFNGIFAYRVDNNYALVANYPYLTTAWAVPTEGFYQGWTIKRTINDYAMAAYAILMTEALRKT